MLRRFAQGSLVLVIAFVAPVALVGPRAHAGTPATPLLAAPRASAAAPPSGSARPSASAAALNDPAQALFDGGVADMEAGRFEKACPAIEASQRLDPRPGTLFTLAECEAQRGRAATAMRYYAEYLTLHRNFGAAKKLEQKDRAKTSEDQLRTLDLLVPKLTIVLAQGSGPDVVVKRDGEVVAELSLGSALPVDPGEHVVTAQSPGGPETSQRISLAPGEAKTVRLSVSRDAAPATSSTAVAPSALPSAAATSTVEVANQRPWRIGTWTAGAAGVAGLVVGTVTGILALQARGDIERNCYLVQTTETCSKAGIAALNRLRALGAASTVAFVTGGVGIGVGVVLLLATPSLPTSPPTVGAPRTSAFFGAGVELHVGGSF